MRNIFKILLLFVFHLMVVCSFAQEGTRNTGTTAAPIGKIMLVPFEPRLYMSEIDMKINQQTNWKFEQIRENFRKQLNAQLKTKLQTIAPVVSFYSDSAKMAKDLAYIYRSTSLRYDLVSNPTSNKPETKESGIKNGQLVVIANTDKKFMNTQIIDKELLPYMTSKYKTDYFVFINQLDIVNNNETYSLATDTYMRDVTVHYSILDKTGKCINTGIATSQFSSKENETKKIVSISFAPIANYITEKLSSFLKPEKNSVKPAAGQTR